MTAPRRKSRPRRTRPPLNEFLAHRRKRRHIIAAAVAIALLALALADRAGWLLAGDDLRRYDGRSFRVTRVIDGDTIDIAAPDGDSPTTRIRLWGIDTPELARTYDDPAKDRPAESFADEATHFTTQACLNQPVQLTLEPHRLRGNYGRLLAHIHLPDGSSLNESLLTAGLACADQRFSHRWIDRYTLLEDQARHDQLGIWQNKP